MTRTLHIAFVSASLLSSIPAVAQNNGAGPAKQDGEFAVLRREYQQVRRRLGGGKKGARQGKGKRRQSQRITALVAEATPVIEKIAELDKPVALTFLASELVEAPVALRPALARGIVEFNSERGPELLFEGFAMQPVVTRVAILAAATGATNRRPYAERAHALVATVTSAAGKLELASLLGSLSGLGVARTLVELAKNPDEDEAEAVDEKLGDQVAASLLAMRQEKDVVDWLGGGAFRGRELSSTEVYVWLTLVGGLDLSNARRRVVKLTGHRIEPIAIAAAAALVQLAGKSGHRELAKLLRARKGDELVSYRMRVLDALGRAGSDSAVAVLLKLTRVKDEGLRAVVMGSLGFARNRPAAIAGVAAGLADRHPYVRAAALRALERLVRSGARDRSMIGGLIEHIARETQYRLRVGSLELLVELSGQNMGFEVTDWRKWWNHEREGFDFLAVGERKHTFVTTRDLSYFGIEIASKRIAFLLDVSNSMLSPARGKKAREQKLSKLDVMKRELAGVVEKLPADAAINILIFDKRIRFWEKQLARLTPSTRKKALGYVEGLTTGGGTNIYDTIELAFRDSLVDTIYLLTDGQATTGRFKDGPGMVRGLRELNRGRGITLHSIAFGRECEWMREAAADNGGQYRYVAE